jgi:hypothetical protein
LALADTNLERQVATNVRPASIAAERRQEAARQE